MTMMSMQEDNQWSAKDGMHTDPVEYCKRPWTGDTADPEPANDWTVAQQPLNYDANLNTLTATFTRPLIGTNEKDYTFKVGTEYES